MRSMVRVNSDEIKKYMFEDAGAHNPANNPPVFGALDYVTEKLLGAGKAVLYDANNNRLSDRAKHQKLAETQGAQTVVLWVKTPLEIAQQRDAGRADVPGYLPIPPERYVQIVHALEEPMPEERVIVVDGLASFEEQLHSFDEQLAALNL